MAGGPVSNRGLSV